MEHSDFVITGGVAAGPKTAATLARRLPRATITLFQKEQHLSYASCGLPYYASGDVNSFEELTKTAWDVIRDAEYFRTTKGFTAVTGAEVTAINRDNKAVTVRREDGSEEQHGYGKLVIATGAHPAKPPFPVEFGERVRCFTRPDDAQAFRALAEKGQVGTAVVVGAGYIGLEMTEALASLWGIEVTLIEKEPQVMPAVLDPEMAQLVEKELRKQEIDLRLNCAVKSVSAGEEQVAVELADGTTVNADYAIVCIGVKPAAELAESCGLELGETGAIAINEYFQTSDPEIYAGGDCVELTHRLTGKKVWVPLGSLANRHGLIIAEHLSGNTVKYEGVLGSYVVKVFDLNLGGTGLNWAASQEHTKSASAVWGTFIDKPEYYPESKTITLKMIYDKDTKQLLGLQGVGEGDIVRRVDVFSSYLQQQATFSNLLLFEPGYAPPYAEAVDPLHHLVGMANAECRGVTFLGPDSFEELKDKSPIWLDVREPPEYEAAPLQVAGIKNLPLNQLRDNLGDLPKDTKIVIVCQRGSRAYQAATILEDAGFGDVVVLGGGRSAIAAE